MKEPTRNQRKYARQTSTLETTSQRANTATRKRMARKDARKAVDAYVAGPLREARQAAQMQRERFSATRKTKPRGNANTSRVAHV